VLVAQMRSVKDNGQLTGGTVAIVTLDGPEPVRASEFASDEIDARNMDHVVSKVVKVSVTHSEVRLTGKIEEHDKSGALTSSKPIDETHPLPPLD